MHIRGISISDGKGRGNSSIYQHILLLTLKMCLVQCNVSLEFRGKSGRFASVILFITSLQVILYVFHKEEWKNFDSLTWGGKWIIVVVNGKYLVWRRFGSLVGLHNGRMGVSLIKENLENVRMLTADSKPCNYCASYTPISGNQRPPVFSN